MPATPDAREAAISEVSASVLAGLSKYAEAWASSAPEDDVLERARQHAAELGAVPISPLVGATLRLLAASVDARAVVEVGTGAGVSGLWLMRGIRADGVLTSVDVEAEHHRVARTAFTEAGYPANRVRLISGEGLDVLPRLADGAYDVAFFHARVSHYPAYLTEARRLLRPGGIAVFAGVLNGGKVTEAAARDADSVALRELLASVRADATVIPLLLPYADGLLALLAR